MWTHSCSFYSFTGVSLLCFSFFNLIIINGAYTGWRQVSLRALTLPALVEFRVRIRLRVNARNETLGLIIRVMRRESPGLASLFACMANDPSAEISEIVGDASEFRKSPISKRTSAVVKAMSHETICRCNLQCNFCRKKILQVAVRMSDVCNLFCDLQWDYILRPPSI